MTTNTPTFDAKTWNQAMAAWRDGRFGPEWADWRRLAARAGIIFPPVGSPDDSWADARPSQRAMVVRAIRETPRLLRWALSRPGIRSWGDVIEHLLTGRDAMGLDADQRDAEWQATKLRRTEPPEHIGGALTTILDSLGMER